MSTFLKSALGKDANRGFNVIHGNAATDGFRVHRDNSLPAVDDEVTYRINAVGAVPTQPRNRATVSRVDLIIACKRALAFRTDWDRNHKWYPTLKFCMNGSLSYSATNEEVGTTSGEITDGARVNDRVKTIKNGLKYESHTMVYKHHNPDKVVTFGINPRFLLDALEGMEGDTVEFDIPAPHAPLYLSDGTREASIMPLTIKA